MKTLLERLKPEYAAALERERDQYEVVCDNIQRALSANLFIHKLTVETICHMKGFIGGEGLSDPWSYFEDDDDE